MRNPRNTFALQAHNEASDDGLRERLNQAHEAITKSLELLRGIAAQLDADSKPNPPAERVISASGEGE